jgi:hypothetical protein
VKLHSRLALSGCVTSAVLAAVLFSLLIMTSAVNRRPSGEKLSLALPILAPIVTLWIARLFSRGARECSGITVSLGSLAGLLAAYFILHLMAIGNQLQAKLGEDDRVQIAVAATAVFAGALLGTYPKRRHHSVETDPAQTGKMA